MGAAENGVTSTGRRDEIVLALSAEGREELRHPQAGLSLRQRKLLMLIDGKRSLQQIVTTEPTLHADRVERDAAALVGRALVEIEKGLLQPIAPRTTEIPAATRPPAAADARKLRTQPAAHGERAAKERKTASRTRPTVWLALAAGGAIAVVAAYLMQPRSAPPAAGTTSAPPQPIASVPPVAPIPQAAADASQPVVRLPEPSGAGAVAAAAPINTQAGQPPQPAPTAPVKTPVAPAAPPERGSNTKVATVPVAVPQPEAKAAASAAAASRAERGSTTSAVVQPATVSPSEVKAMADSAVAAPPRSERGLPAHAAAEPATAPPSEVKPATSGTAAAAAPPAAAPAVVAAPLQTGAPAASEAPAARPPAAPAAPESTAAIAAWTRDFAPVAPDAGDPRMVALTSGLVPIERVPPVYPREAVREGITQGSIRARAVIAASGRVERVEFPALDTRSRVFERPARAALMTWIFPPGERGRVYEVVLNFVAP